RESLAIAEQLFAPFIWGRILTSRRRFEDLCVTPFAVTSGTEFFGQSISPSGELGEAIEIAPLGHVRRPRHQVVALDDGGEFGRAAEEAARLAGGESGEPRRLEIGG